MLRWKLCLSRTSWKLVIKKLQIKNLILASLDKSWQGLRQQINKFEFRQVFENISILMEASGLLICIQNVFAWKCLFIYLSLLTSWSHSQHSRNGVFWAHHYFFVLHVLNLQFIWILYSRNNNKRIKYLQKKCLRLTYCDKA